MTILSVVQNASTKIGIARPTVLYAATTQDSYAMQAVILDAVLTILKAYDWHLLRTIETVTGDGSATGFDLPNDYDRMLTTASLWSSRYQWAMDHIVDTDQWLELLTLPYTQVSGTWTVYGGQLHILDTMALTETAKYWYISNLVVSPSGGGTQAAFTADDDVFRLSEELLRLCIIYKWKQSKLQDYSEEMQDFNILLNRLMNEDGGSKPIIRGTRPVRANYAWPGTVSPVP
jgi:hypothetical protein